MATKRTYTIAEAAELVGLSRKALARRVERGSVRSVIRNGRRLIPRSELVRVGLLSEPGDERGTDVGVSELTYPSAGTRGESESALVNLVRDLMERVERQATEIAQFRALTVQAESLRADRELAELRTRLAMLETQAGAGSRPAVVPEGSRAPTAPPQSGAATGPSSPIWLPPSAAKGGAAAAPRRPVPEPRAVTPAYADGNRSIVLVVEAAFIVVVAVIAGLADLRPLAIVGVIALAWAFVSVVEVLAWRRRRR